MTFIATKLFHKAGEGSGGGGDEHNLGWYATQSALTTAHPTANDGDWAIVGATDTVWVWDSDTTAWKDTDTKGQVTSVNGQTGAVTVDALPSQTGQSGKFLTTDGTDASWSDKPLVNTATGQNSITVAGTATTYGRAINIGNNSSVQEDGVAIGYNAQTTASASVAMGLGAKSSTRSVAIGASSKNTATFATALGDSADVRAMEGIAIGHASYVISGASYGISIQGRAGAQHAIQLGTTGGDTANNDANTFKVANANGNYEIMSADGTIPADRLVHAINKYSTMPTAASTNEGWIVQFTGTTDSTYTHGHLYECVSDGQDPATYSWTEVSMGGGSGLPSQTGQSGKFLTTDGTDASWATINALQNTATGTNSLTILGTATTGARTINIGASTTSAGNDNVVIGYSTSTKNAWDKNVYIGNNITQLQDGQAPSETVAIGYNLAASYHGVVVGVNAKATSHAVSVGASANQNTQPYQGWTGSTAIGYGVNSKGAYSIAIGYLAETTATNSIQINAASSKHTNSDANTFKVGNQNGNYEMMSADGTIPEARLADMTSAAQGQVLTLDGNNNAVWATPSGGGSTALSLTLASANWSNNSITVTATGVTSSNNVIVSPAPASQSAYTSAGVMCTGQSTDSLTFTCTSTPSSDLTVTVLII